MPDLNPEIEAFAVAATGTFLPQIFLPQWFSQQGLLAKKQSEEAILEVASPQVTSFRTEWLRVFVAQNQAFVSTHLEDSVAPLKDLAIGLLSGVTRGSVTAVELNFEGHFQMADEKAWHAVGDRFAPKEIWKGILDTPGLLNLQMQGTRSDGIHGYKRVTIQPSTRLTNGIFVHVSDRAERKTPDTLFDPVEMMSKLWEGSFERSKSIAHTVIISS